MPALADERLQNKVEALLEEKIPAIEIKLHEVTYKQDQMLSKLDSLASTLTEHVTLQTKQDLRIAAIEVKDANAENKREKSRDSRIKFFLSVAATAVSAAIGYLVHKLLRGS